MKQMPKQHVSRSQFIGLLEAPAGATAHQTGESDRRIHGDVLPGPNWGVNKRLIIIDNGFNGFYWILLDFNGFYWILMDFTGF